MRQLILLIAAFLALATAPLKAAPDAGEIIIISGGVSLWQWEKWKGQPHDNWWMNFVRAARLRIQEIKTRDPGAQITWLVFKPSYVTRARQENNDLLSHISSVRDAYGVKLVFFNETADLIGYLNHGHPRSQVKITALEYFGHSNKACWMFDYSNNIDSASKAYLHEKEFGQLKRGIFAKGAVVKSWGCHTGESMSRRFLAATGVPMVGAIGKTQYMTDELPILSSANGRWVR